MIPRILVVDDDDGLRHLLRLVLRREGFEVIEAANGDEALARVHDSSPTLVLLDVMMPGLDGFDVCRRLRSDHQTHRLPIVFVSAINDIKHRNELLKLGADDCIKKPVGPRELVARVRQVMERRGLFQLAEMSASAS
jgi:DNA-binding response OmpR family regulator